MDLTVGFVSRNLFTEANFIEFRNSQIFTIFGTASVRWTTKTGFWRKKILFLEKFFSKVHFKII